ncbi:efflux RND transporter periplasmic adaptor subunit [Aurantimonas sp. A3-2-R12]|uniref:efflux RND transporter periplasmic adaptor subunit n=1 Tax=Aurantimonas sp. A3-2-R12 TaxID=3114362 RepID=UPI002E18AEAF|nr:HlyD family efflux transporter periplasmic adaptor subunit [Aurantimonas sp. A3-2-R12]
MGRWLKVFLALLAALAVGFAFYEALRPKPVPVDVAAIASGPLTVTIDEEGVVEFREIYAISAPFPAKIERSSLHVGDTVIANRTQIATLRPSDPTFIDARSETELGAAIDAANAAVALAEADLNHAQADLRQSESELNRVETLRKTGTLSAKALELAATDVDRQRAQLRRAEAQLAIRQSELASARARLLQPGDPLDAGSSCHCVPLFSPSDGVVLSVPLESETVVPTGTPLAEIGDPRRLEVVVDLLSADAVAVRQGADATITGWGGPDLQARIRRIEPTAFTKVSALGIEEQRVNVRLDIVSPLDGEERPGHRYRVVARIVLWHGEDVRRLPLGALFRTGDHWSVYAVEDGRAVLTGVSIGHRDTEAAELIDGLEPEAKIILFPSDTVSDGVAVTPRQSGS